MMKSHTHTIEATRTEAKSAALAKVSPKFPLKVLSS